MPKRPYSQISSSAMSCPKLSTTSTLTSITDLPVDVLCLVFKRLPLTEVLRNQSLVCKLFYTAHLQHCRSSVKQLTLVCHYMFKGHGHKTVVQQPEVVHKQTLFEYVRDTNNDCSTSTINPSSSHLKLVVGLEESAYAAIGTKFQSVTSLELFQPALERHYKPITAMINAWGGGEEKKKKKGTGGGGGGGASRTNQLTELKIFFNKEIYNTEGTHISRSNSSCCLAYLLAGALTPDKAPALRRLVIVPGNWLVTSKNHGNHNGYRGPLLAKINLSQVVAINAPDFAVIDLPEERWAQHPFSALQELTLGMGHETVQVSWNKATTAAKHLSFRRLTALTLNFGCLSHFVEALGATTAAAGATLRRLSLLGVYWPLTELVQQLVVPLTTSTVASKGEKGTMTTNDRLEELRVAWNNHGSSEILARAVVATESLRVRFPALTTLHLMKSTLLHRADEMSALSALFPNLAHLRLDHSHRAGDLGTIKTTIYFSERHCEQCVQHVWDAFLQCNPGARVEGNYLFEATGDVQLLPSSTAPACKQALVRRAVAAWPQLASITLQIDDFFRITYRSDELNSEAIGRLQYLYRCESLLLRDQVTGEPLQEQDLKWTVEEVPY